MRYVENIREVLENNPTVLDYLENIDESYGELSKSVEKNLTDPKMKEDLLSAISFIRRRAQYVRDDFQRDFDRC